MEELELVIKKVKRRTAPGPDEMPTEVLKELGAECSEMVLELLNIWWRAEETQEDMLRARVVLIFKKGDTSNYEDYKPNSLLNTLYKAYAAVIQKRLSDGLHPNFGCHLPRQEAG